MFHVLYDIQTGTYYMNPGEIAFHIYTDVDNLDYRRNNTKLVSMNIDDPNELQTRLYNDGFFWGYINDDQVKIAKEDLYYYDRNPNEVCFAQFLLTHENRFLDLIKKDQLYTIANVTEDKVLFPTVELEPGKTAILTYTGKSKVPVELLRKYHNWKFVKMTFQARCIVNGMFVVE